jgi:hypothetical protein
MSDDAAQATADDGDALIRMICYAGLLALPALIFFVHLLLIYRA